MSLPGVLFWVYLVNATLLINHEIDSAYWHEWDLFKLPGDIAGFPIIHFPVLFLGMYGLVPVYWQALSGLIFSLVLGAAGLFAFGIHTYFIRKGRQEFTTPISRFILFAALIVSLVQVGLTVVLLGQG
jgi:hypothetical protein